MKVNRKGLVLLEVLLSVVILSVSLSLIIQSMTAALKATRAMEDYTIALFLAENKLNEFALMKQGSVDAAQEQEFSPPFEKYQYLLKIERVQPIVIAPELEPSVDKINEVSLEVSWHSGQAEKKVDLVTYVFDKKEN